MIPKPNINKNEYLHKRYINENILNSIVSPEGKYEGSITSIACAVNAMRGSSDLLISNKDVLRYTNYNLDDVHQGLIGNNEIIEGMNKVCEQLQINAKASILFSSIESDLTIFELRWKQVMEAIAAENTCLIYHTEDRYVVIIGYYEESIKDRTISSNSLFNKNRWIIAHKHGTEDDEPPISCYNWNDIVEDLRNDDNHILISLQKNI